MGQLEKYGLYVLCLVIFLILGVTIWGGGDLPPTQRRPNAGQVADLKSGGAPGSNAPPVSTLGLSTLLDDKKTAKPESHPEDKPVVPGPGAGPGSRAAPVPQPAATPAAAPKPEGEVRPRHKVRGGDSFDSIARHLGSSALRSEIQRLNPKVVPNRMKLGEELQLPTKAEIDQFLTSRTAGTTVVADATAQNAKPAGVAPTAVPAAAGKTTYTVVKGDTFESIALRHLGSRHRLDEVLALNPTVRPTSLHIGQKILLPKK